MISSTATMSRDSGFTIFCNLVFPRAYSSAVERVHGMDEVGVRLPVGPQYPNQPLVRGVGLGMPIRARPMARVTDHFLLEMCATPPRAAALRLLRLTYLGASPVGPQNKESCLRLTSVYEKY